MVCHIRINVIFGKDNPYLLHFQHKAQFYSKKIFAKFVNGGRISNHSPLKQITYDYDGI